MKLFDKIKSLFGKDKDIVSNDSQIKEDKPNTVKVELKDIETKETLTKYEIPKSEVTDGILRISVPVNYKKPEIYMQAEHNVQISKERQNEIQSHWREIDRLVRIQNKTKSIRSKKKLQKRIENLQNKIDKGVK